jgi:CheY-like chemotaxis protein
MAVLGSLEIVQRRMDRNPQISPFIDNAIQAARRGTSLTQRMLAFSRRQELAMGAVDIVETVQGMTEILGRALGPSVLVTTRLPQVLPPAHTDRAQLESALLNLAVNARDAMPSGGPITITADYKTAIPPGIKSANSGGYVVLSVADAGEGMDAQTLARASEPFFTTKGVGKGTGLGLSMVYGLAEQSGGTLVLNSRKGVGTTAEVWLPVAASASDETSTKVEPEFSVQSGSRRVVVVDDDPLVLLNTVTIAEDLGHTVFDAMSGAAALSILEKEDVDLVVTDYAMPGMTGGELAAAVQSKWPKVKILISTGYAQMPEEYKGRFERLSKPFSSDDLQAAIERVFWPPIAPLTKDQHPQPVGNE